jgi:hypothetical protein
MTRKKCVLALEKRAPGPPVVRGLHRPLKTGEVEKLRDKIAALGPHVVTSPAMGDDDVIRQRIPGKSARAIARVQRRSVAEINAVIDCGSSVAVAARGARA